jgi:hypothetical protein
MSQIDVAGKSRMKQRTSGLKARVEAFLREPFGSGITDPLSSEGYLMVRDAIAMGLTTVPFILLLVVSAAMQNWRKKLRGGDAGARPSGGYR